MSTVPSYYDDGDFNVAQQNGAPVLSFPFEDQSDLDSFIYTVQMRMDVDHYKRPTLMGTRKFPLGMAYLVGVSSPQLVGQRLNEWTETWACVPRIHNEYGSATYQYQRIIRYQATGTILTTVAAISEYSDVFSARIECEYSIDRLPDLAVTRWWPVKRLLQVGDLRIEINDVQVTGSNTITGAGEVLAQNSITERWMGGIFVRKSIFIKPILQRFPAEDANIYSVGFIAGRAQT